MNASFNVQHFKSKQLLKLLVFLAFLCFSHSVTAQNIIASFDAQSSMLKCSNTPFALTSTSTSSSGTIIYEKWEMGTGNSSDTITFFGSSNTHKPVNFNYSNGGAYIITLTVKDDMGFQHSVQHQIRVEDSPKAGIDAAVYCFPDGIQFTDISQVATGGIASRQWTVDGLSETQVSFTYKPSSAGVVSAMLRVTSDKGCVDNLSEQIKYAIKPIITFVPDGPLSLCPSSEILISAYGAPTFQWQNGSIANSILANQGGYYYVKGFASNQCYTLDSIEIIPVGNPTADAGQPSTINLGESIKLSATGGVHYVWSPGSSLDNSNSPSPIATPKTTTQYIVTVTDANGCSDKDSVLITVTNIIISVPNMITPNGDGYNDVWDLSTIPDIETASIHVFNRWGWEVFKSESYKNNWRGTFNQEPLPDGSYLYVIEFANDQITPLRGTLEILRNTHK